MSICTSEGWSHLAIELECGGMVAGSAPQVKQGYLGLKYI